MTNAAERSRASFSQWLYSAANLPEAHLVCGLLAAGRSRRPASATAPGVALPPASMQSSRDTCTSLYVAGIEARVFNEYAGGALGELPFAEAAPSVWVEAERDLARARQVVTAYENAAAAPGVTRCGACGEENPRDFSICWQCQRPL